MLRGTVAGSMDWEPTMAASTGRMAMEERMMYGLENRFEREEELFEEVSKFVVRILVSKT